ncbi:MAG: Fe-Mn family superoxide dismutase [Candidatus Woesearchaeota archaeon]
MAYQAKDFSALIGTPGFSEQLLKNHFSLYEGYVKNTNLLIERLNALSAEGRSDTPLFAELKRRFGWEYNGMRLHELYFGNISKNPKPISTGLKKALAEAFGSFESFEGDFKSTGKSRGIGWAVLYMDAATHELFNVWINEHDVGHLAEGKILLIMDVFEHAFMLDYGLNRAAYIDAFWKAVDWGVVEQRLKGA